MSNFYDRLKQLPKENRVLACKTIVQMKSPIRHRLLEIAGKDSKGKAISKLLSE